MLSQAAQLQTGSSSTPVTSSDRRRSSSTPRWGTSMSSAPSTYSIPNDTRPAYIKSAPQGGTGGISGNGVGVMDFVPMHNKNEIDE